MHNLSILEFKYYTFQSSLVMHEDFLPQVLDLIFLSPSGMFLLDHC